MIEIFGNFGISLAFLASAVALVTALAGGRSGSAKLFSASRGAIIAFFVMLTVASGALIAALLASDFSNAYVARYTERALPSGFKLAAFWAGQEGSILLWAWLLAAMAVIFVIARRRDRGATAGGSLASLAGILLFFSSLLLFAANPFVVLPEVPADGGGLNPMLQDPGMIAHPPLLFLGYAGFAFPFVLLIGALCAGRRDGDWLAAVRPWAIASWLFLSIGILLGAQWAYVELGWGGYWAWDPVENASLLPWLTGTALLHSIMVQQHRGMFRRWNAMLVAATFVLCVFGSYLTRSGVIQSVHAFEKSLVGTFFLGFLVLLAVVSLGLIAWRRDTLRPDRPLEGLLGREGMFLAANVVLVGMTVLTLIGTIFPIISRTIGSQEVTVGPNFYNKVVAPLGLLLVALMATGPVLAYGPGAAGKLVRRGVAPFAVATLVVGGMFFGGIRNPWAMICGGITGFAAVAITIEIARATLHRRRVTGEFLPVALLRLIDSTHRRYGGQTVHVGVLLIVIGIVGSSLFAKDATQQLRPGETATVAGRTVTFVKLNERREANFTAVEAEVVLADPRNPGRTTTLRPQRRFYDKSEQPNAEVAIQSSWREDVYLNLAGWEAGGAITAIQVIVNPLVSLLWTGGIVLTAGGVLCMLPRFSAKSIFVLPTAVPQAASATPAAAATEAKPVEAEQLPVPANGRGGGDRRIRRRGRAVASR